MRAHPRWGLLHQLAGTTHDAGQAQLAHRKVVGFPVSMKGHVRLEDRRQIRQEPNWYLPSRSVNMAKLKNVSQSVQGWLNASRIRGLSSSPERAGQQFIGFIASVAAEVGVEVDHCPQDVGPLQH